VQLTRDAEEYFAIKVALFHGNIWSVHLLEQVLGVRLYPKHFSCSLAIVGCEQRSVDLHEILIIHVVVYSFLCFVSDPHLGGNEIYA